MRKALFIVTILALGLSGCLAAKVAGCVARDDLGGCSREIN